MSSSASEDALLAFLAGANGAPGDVLTTINGEIPNTVVTGSVNVVRASRGSSPRIANPYPVSVEIVQRGDPKATPVGIGNEEVVYTVDLQCNVRRKDLSGAAQLQLARGMAAALVRRYQRVSNLAPLYVRQATVEFLGATLAGYSLTITASGTDYVFDLSTLASGASSLQGAINFRTGLNNEVVAEQVGTSEVVLITPRPERGCTSLELSLVAGGTPDQVSVENNVGSRLVLAMASRVEIDTDPEVSERIRAVTRVSFTFLESSAENA